MSKVLLEREACRFAEEHGISLVTLCPVVTVGAAPAVSARTSVPNCLSLLSGVRSIESKRQPLVCLFLCAWVGDMASSFSGDEAAFAVLDGMERASGSVRLVHVEDLCRAELFAAEEDDAAAAGRYICCSLNTTIAELARFLADKYPQHGVKTHLL